MPALVGVPVPAIHVFRAVAYPGPRGAQRRRVIRGSSSKSPRSGTVLSLRDLSCWVPDLRAVSLRSPVLVRDTRPRL